MSRGEVKTLVFADGTIITPPATEAPPGLSKDIAVSFSAEQSKDVDVSAYGVNAEECIAQLWGSAGVEQCSIAPKSGSESTHLTITFGAATTGSFTLKVLGVNPQ